MNIFSGIYYFIAIACLCYYVFAIFQNVNQNTKQFIHSFYSQTKYLIYYYGILQYGLALIISIRWTAMYGRKKSTITEDEEPAQQQSIQQRSPQYHI